MPWKDNALGIVVDSTMDVDFAALKSQGISFVLIEAGTGFEAAPAMAEQFSKAAAAGLPALGEWIPISALDDYTFEAPAREEIPIAQKALTNKAYQGFVVSAERWWVGWDVEQQHQPVRVCTGAAINYTMSEFVNTFAKNILPLNKQVLVRTNDGFVQKYSVDMTAWTDKWGFWLADWRYRTRAADGSYTLYTIFPALTVSNVADLRAALPPDGCKNPLIPGNAPQLKFWEFTGSVTFPTTLVKGWDGKAKKVKCVLFNGDETAMKNYLGVGVVIPPPVDPGTGGTDPTDPSTGTVITDLTPVVDELKKNESLLTKLEAHGEKSEEQMAQLIDILGKVEAHLAKIAGHMA